MKFIKDLAIAPLCYYYDLGQNDLALHWNLVDFVPGKVVEKLSNKHILQLAQILQKLHSQTIGSKHGDRWNELESTMYKCFVLLEYLEKYPGKANNPGFEELKGRFEKINWGQCSQFCLIHNDLKNLNMVENEGQIKLIDWEYSYMDIPENDIARLFIENKFTNFEKELFLDNYLPEIKRTKLIFDLEKLEVLTNLYEFFEVGKNIVQPIFGGL